MLEGAERTNVLAPHNRKPLGRTSIESSGSWSLPRELWGLGPCGASQTINACNSSPRWFSCWTQRFYGKDDGNADARNNWNLRCVIHSRATSNGKDSSKNKETDDDGAFEGRRAVERAIGRV